MRVVHTISELRQSLALSKCPAFVPTMGNLHRGHLALVEESKTRGDCSVASIFVNRLQFLPHEDFDRYPRSWDADCRALKAVGCDLLFAPSEHALYPEAQSYKVTADPALAGQLEGQFRPGFFDGVCTVVMKLFIAVFAGKSEGFALFGKKDYQQLRVIEAMTRQFALPIDVVAVETTRDADGLALSSRNNYLSATERIKACALHQQLLAFADRYRQLPDCERAAWKSWVAAAEQKAITQLNASGWVVDYLSLRSRLDLQPAQSGDALVLLAAARLGETRLIDSLEF
ncbi:MAG: pantoate--beta-alanine ligase [Betaproteobacteria bacterium]|nr:pantoate--beta-alanine ligase [Betaproteobacteria bacterium]